MLGLIMELKNSTTSEGFLNFFRRRLSRDFSPYTPIFRHICRDTWFLAFVAYKLRSHMLEKQRKEEERRKKREAKKK